MLRGLSLWWLAGTLALPLDGMLRSHLAAASLEQAGYSTLASIDLAPLMDSPTAVAVDSTGCTYALGATETAPSGAQRIGVGGEADVIITKFDPAGQIIYSTVVGGENYDYGTAIAVDSLGQVVVAGQTSSTNFPLQHAVQTAARSYYTWFVFRLTDDGGALVHSTYYGTGWDDRFGGLALASNRDAILVGHTSSTDFPVTSNAVQKLPSFERGSYSRDAVVVRLGAQGSNVVFSTYLGGRDWDEAVAVSVDASGVTWIAGSTSSPDFPVTPDAAQPLLHIGEDQSSFPRDAFLLRLGSDGSILYSSYLDLETNERVTAMSFAPNGSMLLAWRVERGFQVVQPRGGSGDAAFQPELLPANQQQEQAFVAVLNPQSGGVVSIGRLVSPTYSYSVILQIAGDSHGRVHLTGQASSAAFLAEFDPAPSRFTRFIAFENCGYSTLNGPVVGPGDELFITSYESGASYDVLLRKVRPSLPPPTNHAPLVSLGGYGPSPGWGDPRPLTISPFASDVDGAVEQVQLYAGATLLAVLTNAPHAFAWTNPPYGEHSLRAVATDNAGLSSTSCPVVYRVFPPPDNDSFYRSRLVSGASFAVTGTTRGATSDSGQRSGPPQFSNPDPFGNGPSVWWCWRAPHNGAFSLAIDGSPWFHTVTVFVGTDLDHLTRLGQGNPAAFQALAGTAYYIRVTGFFEADYVLSLRPVIPPANDNFSDRALISGAPLSIQAHNFNATFESGLAVTNSDDFGSVWWTWTSPGDGVYRFSLVSTNSFGVTLRVGQSYASQSPSSTNAILVTRAAAGEQFHIRVTGVESQFEWRVDSMLPPPNDHFADAIALTGLPDTVNGSLLGASRETNEPPHAYFSYSPASVWYKWTAPQAAPVILEINSNYRAAFISVYTGPSLDALTLETRSPGYDAPVYFFATAGTEYHIAVDDFWSGTADFTLTIRSPNYPANDKFDQRIPVTDGGFGSNAEATIEPIEFGHLQNEEVESIWYSWVAPATGDFTLVIHNFGFYGRGAVYTQGEFGSLERVDQQTNSAKYVRFSAVSGTEYAFAFISARGQGGGLAFRVRPSNTPLNDDFQDAAVLSGASVLVEGSNVDATIETAEPIHSYPDAAASVWWTWTAPHAGPFVVSLPRAAAAVGVIVYRGAQLSTLTRVPFDYALSDSVLFDATPGEQYWIAVYSIYNQQGEFTLAITPITRPSNDDFENSAALHGASVSVVGTTLGATPEPGENSASVWWSWTASAGGLTSVKITLARPLEVFSGPALETLTRIVGSSNSFRASSLTFNADAGATYHIRVSGEAFSPFTLSLLGPVAPERPVLSGLSRNLDGTIQFAFDARIGLTNVIDASTDLQNWSPISTNLTDCFPYPFTAPAPASHRFYRVRLLPH